MIKPLLLVFLSIFIGAGIGALTNSIAILMLFRPHQQIRLPLSKKHWWFTPGLIPRRQGEIAYQLGQIVEHKLLKQATLEREINQNMNARIMEQKLQTTLDRWIKDEESLYTLLLRVTTPDELEQFIERLEQQLLHLANRELEAVFDVHKDRQVKDILHTLGIQEEQIIMRVKEMLLPSLKAYLGSVQGRRTLEELISQLLAERGGLGSLLQSITPLHLISGKLATFLMECLERETVAAAFDDQLIQLIQQWTNKSSEEAINMLTGRDSLKVLRMTILVDLSKKMNLLELSKKPLAFWFSDGFLKEYPAYITLISEKMGSYLPELIKSFLQRIKLAEIVEREVNQYPMQELEQVIRGLAQKELKLITLLGGMIGGLIGLIQAFIYLLLT